MVEENIVSYSKRSWQIDSLQALVDLLSVSFRYIRADTVWCFVGLIVIVLVEYPDANLRMVWRSVTLMLAVCG